MFTKNKDDVSPTLTPAQDAVRSASSKPASRVGASIICSDMEIVGSIKSQGALQIDGKVEGDVSAGDVTIGSTGKIVGEIKAETLRVKGHVKGAIRARKVELETGAHVQGDIIHAALIIQQDASFEGQVKRKDDPLSVQDPRPASNAIPDKGAAGTLGSPISGPSGNA